MLTEENFHFWNSKKTDLHFKDQRSFIVEKREIWLVYLGVNIGIEQNGNINSFL